MNWSFLGRVLWRAAVGVAFVLILVAGCRTTEKAHRHAPTPARIRAPVCEVRSLDRPVRASAVGVLTARRRSVVSARLTALVLAVLVREGESVRAGQELIRLDDREPTAVADGAQASIREAEAGVEEAERAASAAARGVEGAAAASRLAALTRARTVPLFAKGGVSAQARDEAVSRDDAMRADLARSREALAAALARRNQAASRLKQSRAGSERASVGRSDAVLTAPFAGVVATRPVDPGALASPGVALMTIEDPDPRLECLVPGTWIERVHRGDTVPVDLDSPAQRLQGRVDEISPSADPRSHTVLVRLALPAGLPRRSGSYGRASFEIAHQSTLTVPSEAVVARGQIELVFVVGPSGVARLRLVRTGESEAGRVEVLAGVEVGERVACGSVDRLSDGDIVEVAP